jgi:hypothetical protein
VYARGDFQGDTAAVSLRQGFPSEAGNLALLHWQPDGILDLSDAVSEVHFLFDGGPAHPLAIPGQESGSCVLIDGCTSNTSCP